MAQHISELELTSNRCADVGRLSRGALTALPATVAKPDRPADDRVGIVHFGPGAFHRAHQAAFIDTLLDTDPRWGIAAVALRSWETVAALAEQDGLYTLAIRDAAPSFRVVGAHRRFLCPGDEAQVAALLADPAIELVTMTVTEKGYCLGPDGNLNLGHADIAADLAGEGTPRSLIGWLVAGLSARHDAGFAPFALLSCDNVPANGSKLKDAVVAFAQATGDQTLADWIADHVVSPNTMVDAITPAADDALLGEVAAAIGLTDQAPVQREAFAQWVIEDCGRPLGPDLAAAGAIVTTDIHGFERAKLRLLNASHSTIAYAGLLRGHATVAQAMTDVPLADFVAAMMATEIAPGLPPVVGLDLAQYQRDVLARFANPMIAHRLDQIGQDGSQKLPFRLADSWRAAEAAGRPADRILAAFGFWVAFLITRARDGIAIVDPASERLTAIAASGDAAVVVEELASAGLGLPTDLTADARNRIVSVAEQVLAADWSALARA